MFGEERDLDNLELRKQSWIMYIDVDVVGIVTVAVATVICWGGGGVPRIVAVVDVTAGCNGSIVIGGVSIVAVAHEIRYGKKLS